VCDIGALESEDPVQQTFTVNATDDVNDGLCNVAHCSFREALLAANDNPGLDAVEFNINRRMRSRRLPSG
jgi:CSLREA domain-containing protein